MGALISFNITPKIAPIIRPARPPQIAPNGQRFDPSASPITAVITEPATKHATDQTGKSNFLGDVGSSGGVFITVFLPNVKFTGGDVTADERVKVSILKDSRKT